MIKINYILLFLGVFVGISFSFWEGLVSYNDIAPPDESIIKTFSNVVSNHFFNKNTLIYILIGLVIGIFLNFFANIFNKKNHIYTKN